MEKTVQDKRKKFLIIIPIVIAGLIIGSVALSQNDADIGKTTTINDGKTPLAAPAAQTTAPLAAAPFATAPITVAAGGTVIGGGAVENAGEIQQLTENLAAAQEDLNDAQAELDAAKEELEALKTEAEKTEAELTAANDKVAEAQAKVDANKELKKIYEATIAVTATIKSAAAQKGNVVIDFQLTADGSRNGTKDLYDYFKGNADKDIISTGANYAPGFTKAVNDYGKQNNLEFDLGDYFYKAYWTKNGVLNVIIVTGEDSQFWTTDAKGNDQIIKDKVEAYKFYGNSEGDIAAGTLNLGNSQTSTKNVDNLQKATISEKLTDEKSVISYEEIKAAEQELEQAKQEQAEAAAKDKLAQDAVKAGESNVAEKQTIVDAAQAEVDSAQAELDAANAE